jgi:predicted aldo/keto reductase-like oxidoreductase
MKLGFRCMRLPLKEGHDQGNINYEEFTKMVDTFIEKGGTYFDTAYMYHNFISEVAVR